MILNLASFLAEIKHKTLHTEFKGIETLKKIYCKFTCSDARSYPNNMQD